MKSFIISEEHAGKRLDVYLTEQFPENTRASLQKLFELGNIKIRDNQAKPGVKLREGDVVSVDDAPLQLTPKEINLPILYEDDDVLVVDKPTGVLSHAKGGFSDEGTVASFCQKYYSLGTDEVLTNRSGIVHRLDRDTSGVMVVAKHAAAQKWLQKQFATRNVKKTYHALVAGVPDPAEAVIDAPIARNPKKPQSFMVKSNGKSARTQYKVQAIGKACLLELRPETGRTHQIRVHLAYIRHPIIGDRVYGKSAERLFLHATKLELTLPNRARTTFESSLPKQFTEKVHDV